MKLRRVHIKEFRSIWDSNPFDVGQVTCLVGKNEAGKTSVLQAIYRLNPIVESDGVFDVTDDYPRSEVEDYEQAVEAKKRQPATVVAATFALDPEELHAVAQEVGPDALSVQEVVLSKGYALEPKGKKSTLFVSVPVVEAAVVKHLLATFVLPKEVEAAAGKATTLEQLASHLAQSAQSLAAEAALALASAEKINDPAEKAIALERANSLAESEPAKALRARIVTLQSAKSLGDYLWQKILRARLPKFLYFDEYYQMRGHDNVEALKDRKAKGELRKSDHPLLGLIELARLDLDKLLNPSRTQDLKNKLQGASNHLTSQVLKYWSQNRHLQMTFDVRPAAPNDPPEMQTGTNIWGEVYDQKHLASTGLGTRSSGFVWFFSFLAWYSSERKKDESLVLLLDEPGLSLHGRAQEDLLKYFEAEIVSNPKHQLIYTTHSPFMVDVGHFDRVRIVQDKGIDSDKPLAREEDGAKVFTDVLEAGPDSLFPLQGALGYDLHQSLFVGPHCLVVEGVSDLLYIQTLSAALDASSRMKLDPRWTITPVGGSDKVPTFVALLGAQRNLSIATLIDFQKRDAQSIESLYRRKLLMKNRVLTYADFTGAKEADVEDMFDEPFYLQLVADEFSVNLSPSDVTEKHPRIVVRLERHFSTNPLPKGVVYNHYRPARRLAEMLGSYTIPSATLDRFENAFKSLNALLG